MVTKRDTAEEIVTKPNFRLAYPELYNEIFEDGRRAGYSERVEEERARTQGTKKPATVPEHEDKETKKKRLVDEYREAHPGVSVKDAILAVGKANRELFR